MTARSSKAKSKRRRATKARARQGTGKPLLAAATAVRRARPAKARPEIAVQSPYAGNPMLGIVNLMGRTMTAYAEFPLRLAQCRSPFDVWLEQARLAQRILQGR